MTKILKDSTYDELKAKADRLDAIVAKLRESAVGFDLDELTGESIIDFIETGSKIDEALEADTQAELETAKTRITELEKELETANARVAELEKELDETPAEEPAAITAKGETGGEEQDILKFAKKNENNPFTVLDKMKEQGFI